MPIKKETKIIFKNLDRKILLNSNNLFFFRKINKTIELNHEEIVVAMGIMINPTLLK